MSAPTKAGASVTSIRAAMARALSAGDRSGEYESRRREQARRERLERAKPRVSCEDADAIARGTLRQTRHLAVVQGWLDRGGRSSILCLAGMPGTGKSLAAAWALAQLGGAYLSANDMVRLAAGGWREQARLEDILRARLLVLDDLGTESDQSAMQAPLLDLVDRRQGRPWLTIITTNIAVLSEMQNRYPDQRLWSRLDHCWSWVPSKAPDYRRDRASLGRLGAGE